MPCCVFNALLYLFNVKTESRFQKAKKFSRCKAVDYLRLSIAFRNCQEPKNTNPLAVVVRTLWALFLGLLKLCLFHLKRGHR